MRMRRKMIVKFRRKSVNGNRMRRKRRTKNR